MVNKLVGVVYKIFIVLFLILKLLGFVILYYRILVNVYGLSYLVCKVIGVGSRLLDFGKIIRI